jgi:hypothetical protein
VAIYLIFLFHFQATWEFDEWHASLLWR